MFDNVLMNNVNDCLVYEKAAKYKGEFLSAYITMKNNIKIGTEMETD